MDTIIVIIYLVLIVAPISTFMHELGHALGAKFVKADQITLLIGVGKPLKTVTMRKIEFVIHKLFFTGGLTKSERKYPYKKIEMIWITALGPMMNAIIALFSYFLYLFYPNIFLYLLFLFNSWLSVVNIIPFKIKGNQTDGYTILQLLKQ